MSLKMVAFSLHEALELNTQAYIYDRRLKKRIIFQNN